MVYSTYTKLRIVHYHSRGHKPYTIARLLKENDGITVSRCATGKPSKILLSQGRSKTQTKAKVKCTNTLVYVQNTNQGYPFRAKHPVKVHV